MLKLAYPADFLTAEIEAYLADAEVAALEPSGIAPKGDIVSTLTAVNSVDLPQLLLDGVFDVAVSSRDRVVEADLAEQQRFRTEGRHPRQAGSIDRVPARTDKTSPRLVWGFSASHFNNLSQRGSFSAEAALLDLARAGRAFVPGADPGGRLICVTTHPETAAATFTRLNIRAEIRTYPDPWRVISPAANFCGLSLWDPVIEPPSTLCLALQQPVAPGVPVLVSNEVAIRSPAKGPLIAQLRNRNRRLRTAQRFSVLRMLISANQTRQVEAIDGVEYARVVPRGNASEVTAWVRRERLYATMDISTGLGARDLVVLDAERLDLGRERPC